MILKSQQNAFVWFIMYFIFVLKKVTSMYKEADLDILDVVIDRTYRMGNEYVDNLKNVKCKSIIVRFTTFRHQTRSYCAKKKF